MSEDQPADAVGRGAWASQEGSWSVDVTLLSAFVRVSEIGSISEAAPVLGYSQPGLSQRIHVLERRLGCRLFERGPSGVVLTPTGQAVLPYARIMITVAEELAGQVRRP